MVKQVHFEQGTQEWLDWRINGITATEASAAMGVNEYATALSVYHQKLNPQPHEPSKYEEWGTRLEDVIKFGKFASVHPEYEVRQGECYENEWRKCSLDGELWKDGKCVAILEIKTGRNESKWDPIPPGYLAQVMWQMHVTGIHKAYFAVLINGCDYFEREVDYDADYVAKLEERCAELWQCICNKVPPKPVNPDIDQPLVLSTVDDDREDAFEVPAEEAAAYVLLKEQAAAIDEKLKAAKMKLVSYFQHAKRLTFQGRSFGTIVTMKGRETIDAKRLKADYPDIYEKVLKQGAPTSYPKFG